MSKARCVALVKVRCSQDAVVLLLESLWKSTLSPWCTLPRATALETAGFLKARIQEQFLGLALKEFIQEELGPAAPSSKIISLTISCKDCDRNIPCSAQGLPPSPRESAALQAAKDPPAEQNPGSSRPMPTEDFYACAWHSLEQ